MHKRLFRRIGSVLLLVACLIAKTPPASAAVSSADTESAWNYSITSVNFNWSNTPPPGQLLMMAIEYRFSDTLTVPSGWSCPFEDSTSADGSAICWKLAGASEPTNVVVTQSAAGNLVVIGERFAGAATTQPQISHAQVLSTASLTTSPLTPNLVGMYVAATFFHQRAVSGTGTLSTPTGYTADASEIGANVFAGSWFHSSTTTPSTVTPISSSVTSSETAANTIQIDGYQILISPSVSNPCNGITLTGAGC